MVQLATALLIINIVLIISLHALSAFLKRAGGICACANVALHMTMLLLYMYLGAEYTVVVLSFMLSLLLCISLGAVATRLSGRREEGDDK
jgi:hypothetical protein